MIITYHEIGIGNSPDIYKVSVAQFEEHLRVLQDVGNTLGIDYHDRVVTFDDGHISHYDLALPVLAKHRMHSAFFITTEWVGSSNRVSQQQIRDILRAGHEIGSHSLSHPFLPDCSDEQLRYELRDSRRKLEDILGVGVTSISLPYGRWDRRVFRACREAGYTKVYTSDPWLPAAMREGIMSSGRLTIRNSFTTDDLHSLLTAKGLAKLRLQAPFRVKQALRSCIGDHMYHWVWHLFAHRDPSLIPSFDRRQ